MPQNSIGIVGPQEGILQFGERQFMKQAVEKIVRSLVGEPEAVEVTEASDGKTVRLGVRVAQADMGRLIGREGRTIKAIRSILFMTGQKQGKRFHLDLIEE